MKTVVEGGHFYAQEGFLPESKKGWNITKNICQEHGNESMLFIDDVHKSSPILVSNILPIHINTGSLIAGASNKCMDIIALVNQNNSVTVDTKTIDIKPQHIILESEMQEYTYEVSNVLENLPRKRRIRHRDGKGSFCSNAKVLYSNGDPTCIGFDLGLTLLKQRMGFDRALNVLPEIYREQQAFLKRIYTKVDKDFKIEQLYY